MSLHDLTGAYPNQAAERDRWILARRGARKPPDPFKPSGFMIEEERSESGRVASVTTIFLANRECPWRCLMCDLWKNTLTETVPLGGIPAQIDFALAELAQNGSEGFQPASSGGIATRGSSRDHGNPLESQSRMAALRQIKLYNSGSFFDPLAIPLEDHTAIARRVATFERVIVECHPALVGGSV